MAKNDFDIDFDFEKEYGFDPKAILDSEYTDDDLDLSQFDDEALGLDLGEEADREFDDFDLDDLDLAEEPQAEAVVSAEIPEEEDTAFAQEEDLDDMDLGNLDFEDEEEEDIYPDDADLTADMEFTRRANFFGMDTGKIPQEPAYEEPAYQEPVYEEPAYEKPVYEETEEFDQELPEEPAEKPRRERRERPKKERKPIQLTMPPVLTNLVHLYFPSQQEIRARAEMPEGRRR